MYLIPYFDNFFIEGYIYTSMTYLQLHFFLKSLAPKLSFNASNITFNCVQD